VVAVVVLIKVEVVELEVIELLVMVQVL